MLFLFLLNIVFAQTSAPRFSRLAISETGCHIYSPDESMLFELTLSEDSSEVWTAETEIDSLLYSVICVKFNDMILELTEDKTFMIESYLDFLKTQFEIIDSAGYGEGHSMTDDPSVIGVIDFWVDDENYQYSVKSWCNGEILAVMLVHSYQNPENVSANVFLNGFRFPGH